MLCPNCGLIFSNPMWTEESVSDFYEKHYATVYRGSIPLENMCIKGGGRPERIFNFTKALIPVGIPLSVLEVGCDLGMNLYPFAQAGYPVKGIDLDETRVSFGSSFYNINLKATSLDKETGRYSLIILSHLLEHVVNLDAFLRQIQTLLADKAFLYIEVPGVKKREHSPEHREPYVFVEDIQNAHTYYFSLTSLTNVMNKNGFELIEGDEIIQSLWKYTGLKDAPLQNDYQSVRISLTQITPLQKELRQLKQSLARMEDTLQRFCRMEDTLNYSLYFRWCRFIYNRVRRPIFRHLLTGNVIGVLSTLKNKVKK